MAATFEQRWDERIIRDLTWRVRNKDRKWANHRDIMENEGKGKYLGNLVRDVSGVLRSKLIARNPIVGVKTDDPNFSDNARELKVAANHVMRVIDLKELLTEASLDALWSTTAWIEVGHSLSDISMDLERTVKYRAAVEDDVNDLRSRYVPVTPEEVTAQIGDDHSEVSPIDPVDLPGDQQGSVPPAYFDSDIGMPWATVISPFMVVHPRKARKITDLDYVTKLVVMTAQELFAYTGTKVKGGWNEKWKTVYNEEPGFDKKEIDEPIILAVTYIKRDRIEPEKSGWFLIHVLGDPKTVIKSVKNPYGGLMTMVPVSLVKKKKYWGGSVVSDIAPLAKTYSKMLVVVDEAADEAANTKILVGSNTTMEPTDRDNYLDPTYTGEVNVKGDVNQISRAPTKGFPHDMLPFLSLFSQVAQAGSKSSDIERGVAVKKITARQTEALLDASDLHVSGMRIEVARSARIVIIKTMYILGLFMTRGRVFDFGGETVKMNAGENDYTTSFAYDIDVKDLQPLANSEDQMVFMQLLRALGQDPEIRAKFSSDYLADRLRSDFGMGAEALLNSSPQKLPIDNAGANELNSNGVTGPEHPERIAGDQGLLPDARTLLAGNQQRSG